MLNSVSFLLLWALIIGISSAQHRSFNHQENAGSAANVVSPYYGARLFKKPTRQQKSLTSEFQRRNLNGQQPSPYLLTPNQGSEAGSKTSRSPQFGIPLPNLHSQGGNNNAGFVTQHHFSSPSSSSNHQGNNEFFVVENQNNNQISNTKNQFANNNHQLSSNNHQFSNNNHQLSNNNHQLSNNNHQFSNNKHQLSNNNHQLSNNNHQFSNNNHQLSNNNQQQFSNIISGDLSNGNTFGSFLSSSHDIHTDAGSLNPFGINLLSNEGVNDRHHSTVPFDTSFDNSFTNTVIPEHNQDLYVVTESLENHDNSFVSSPSSSLDHSPQINNEGFIINPQPINTQTFSQGGNSFGISIPSLNSNSGSSQSNNFNPHQGGSHGISIPSIDSNSASSESGHGLTVVTEGHDIQKNPLINNHLGIPLPHGTPSEALNSIDSLLGLLTTNSNTNGANNGDDPLGSLTIGQLLMGINGQNGIMVVPQSAIPKSLQAGSSDNTLTLKLDDSNEKDDNIVVISPTTPPPTIATRRTRTTTRAPDHIRKSLSDLWYSKGQWLGTILGGMIDFGRIAAEAFKNNTNFASPPSTSYGSSIPTYKIDTSSEESNSFTII